MKPALFALVAALSIGHGHPGWCQDKDDFAKVLQGSWKVMRLETGGEPRGKGGVVGEVRIREATLELPRLKEGGQVKFFYDLAAAKDPAQIDLYADEKKTKLQMRGIYKLDGDTLTLCVAPAAADRPTAFKTTKEDGAMLYTLTRNK